MGFVVVNNTGKKTKITSPFGTETEIGLGETSRIFQGSGGSYQVVSGDTTIAEISLDYNGDPIVKQIDKKANLKEITVSRIGY